MKKNDIIFKGTREGLHLVVNAEENLVEFQALLRQKLEESSNFFSGANITLENRGALVPAEIIEEIRTLLESHGMKVSDTSEDMLQKMRESAERSGSARIFSASSEVSDSQSTRPVVRGMQMEQIPLQADTIMVKRTLRAGQCVSFDGNVIVMGDVNPGAEVEASCDIVVWGTLRGMAHAGMMGNTKAKVVALRVMASQLRIANKITRAPDGAAQVPLGPEVASIKNDSIVIEPWTSQSGTVFD